MSEPPNHDSHNGRPQTQPMAAPFLEFDLLRELEQLHAEPKWSSGQNARTLVKLEDFRVVLMTLRARSRIPLHQAKGRISIHTVFGHIVVRAEGRAFKMPRGALLALDKGLPHDVEAVEDSAFLLTMT
jgi:quercetin dioxygenase-like cupin family protein